MTKKKGIMQQALNGKDKVVGLFSSKKREEIQIQKRFDQLVAENRIHVNADPAEPEKKYIIARYTTNMSDAVGMVENIDNLHLWERLKQMCFINGMIDGIRTYLTQIAKLNEPLKNEKGMKLGRELLDHLETERKKLS